MKKIFLVFLFITMVGTILPAKVVCEGNCEAQNQSNPGRKELETEKRNLNPDANVGVTDDGVKRSDTSKSKLAKLKTGMAQGYQPPGESNLPGYLKALPANQEHTFVFAGRTEANGVLYGLDRGVKLKLVIRQDIVASPQAPSPVVGEVVTGEYAGSILYGEASLEGDLKRILFKFSSMSGGRLNSAYNIKASGLDVLGRLGIEGKYHAKDLGYGGAAFLATTAAVATDSQVERSQTLTGNYVENPSAGNAIKKGLAGSFGKVADRLFERAAQIPGYTEVDGPIFLNVLLEDEPKVRR